MQIESPKMREWRKEDKKIQDEAKLKVEGTIDYKLDMIYREYYNLFYVGQNGAASTHKEEGEFFYKTLKDHGCPTLHIVMLDFEDFRGILERHLEKKVNLEQNTKDIAEMKLKMEGR